MAPTIVLFSEERPNVYHISQIYDPDTNPEGQIVPRVNSIVIETEDVLKKVSHVDATTKKATLVPLKTLPLLPDEIDNEAPDDNFIVDYGNTRFFMYFDTSVQPTRLNPDAKIIIIGNTNSYFQVWKKDPETSIEERISIYYDQSGVFQGHNIPLIVATGTVNVKYLTNCHTNRVINNGDILSIKIFDYAGVQTGEIICHAKRATIQNEIPTPMIEELVLKGSQELGDAFYLYAGQALDNLIVTPTLIYSNGEEKEVPIDNLRCHMYTDLEDFIPSFPGQRVEVFIKYFLSPTEEAVNATVFPDGTRFLSAIRDIVVLTNSEYEFVTKISVVPRWISGLNYYKLYFYLYTLGQNTVRDVTNNVTLVNPFNGQNYNDNQLVQMRLQLDTIFPLGQPFVYDQNCLIQLRLPTNYEQYIITDSPGDSYGVYGAETPTLKRPILRYDPVLMQYYIPTSKFPDMTSMLESFYFKSRPLYDQVGLDGPPTPTHFTLRNVTDGNILLTSPIQITSYNQKFSIVGTPANRLVGRNVIVEFLRHSEDTGFSVVYGVPVDVILE